MSIRGGTNDVAGVTVVSKKDEQSAVPERVGIAEARTARRPMDVLAQRYSERWHRAAPGQTYSCQRHRWWQL